ncbi:MAG: pentapeptide repeat-containing protein [Proteobacteria bacterium]|nr:pentapeptide repeat-containing protein [Pseudomonadota bacterium]
MASGPKPSTDPMYQLLRDEHIGEFNAKKAAGAEFDIRGTNLQGLDLRELDVEGIDFSGCYLRGSDLRGLDFSSCRLEGVSIRNAKISGVYLPKELTTNEILMSLNHGTRMRYKTL